MNRILILGPSGSGKTTLGETIGKLLNIPIIHLDQYFWNPGWIPTSTKEWRKKVKKLISGEAWVMDGNYTSTLALRSKSADLILFLKVPRRLSYFRAIRRILKYYGTNRPDLPKGCPENVNLEFLKYIWNYPMIQQPQILEFLEKLRLQKKILILNNSNEVKIFLKSL